MLFRSASELFSLYLKMLVLYSPFFVLSCFIGLSRGYTLRERKRLAWKVALATLIALAVGIRKARSSSPVLVERAVGPRHLHAPRAQDHRQRHHPRPADPDEKRFVVEHGPRVEGVGRGSKRASRLTMIRPPLPSPSTSGEVRKRSTAHALLDFARSERVGVRERRGEAKP